MRHPHLSPGANIQQKLFTASKKYKCTEIQLHTEMQIYTDVQISEITWLCLSPTSTEPILLNEILGKVCSGRQLLILIVRNKA